MPTRKKRAAAKNQAARGRAKKAIKKYGKSAGKIKTRDVKRAKAQAKSSRTRAKVHSKASATRKAAQKSVSGNTLEQITTSFARGYEKQAKSAAATRAAIRDIRRNK